MKIRFLSGNQCKIAEAKSILEKNYNIEIVSYDKKIEEIQTNDTEKLVKDKVLKAFNIIRKPIFVEHTGLYLEYLNDFPGGLTQIFWDSLQADKFSELIGRSSNSKAIAKTIIGYCDGRKIHYFKGEIGGRISNEVRGDRSFQWDCIFIPDGYDKTFAELGDVKNEISMRRKALDEFLKHLRGENI